MTIGEDGATIAANTLIKDALQIVNGVEPGEYDVDYGTVTITSISTPITVPHALQKVPTVTGISGISMTVGAYDSMTMYTASASITADKNNVYINVAPYPSDKNAFLVSGQKITWVAIAKK